MIAKILIGTAVVAGSLIMGAAPADASPQPGPVPSPFAGLGSNTPQTGPAPGDPAFAADIQRGLLAGAAR
jgi:hypothetical protein